MNNKETYISFSEVKLMFSNSVAQILDNYMLDKYLISVLYL